MTRIRKVLVHILVNFYRDYSGTMLLVSQTPILRDVSASVKGGLGRVLETKASN